MISCEHGGNQIPPVYRKLFRQHTNLLQSHRGYDKGALEVAQELAARLQAPLYASTISRLLADVNRSVGHPALFSEITRTLPERIRQQILQESYYPYRRAVQTEIEEAIRRGQKVLHLSIHSFTPEFDGEVRTADIGLLYDPSRTAERTLCLRWRALLYKSAPALRFRLNYPYSGKSDGLATALRRQFSSIHYAGIECELNQIHANGSCADWRAFRRMLLQSVTALFGQAFPDYPVPAEKTGRNKASCQN